MDLRVEHTDGTKVVYKNLIKFLREGDTLKVLYFYGGSGTINFVEKVEEEDHGRVQGMQFKK